MIHRGRFWNSRATRARHGEQILAAEPGIRRIVSYVARDDFTDHKRRVLVAAELSALDATVVVERMAAVLLELGRQAGYSTSGVIDCFPDSHSAGPSGEDR